MEIKSVYVVFSNRKGGVGKSTFSTLTRMDFGKFVFAFNQWALQYVPLYKGDTRALDGKAIAGTAVSYHNSYRNFVSPVSVFACKRGIVPGCDKTEIGKESEIPTVCQLIETLDAKSH